MAKALRRDKIEEATEGLSSLAYGYGAHLLERRGTLGYPIPKSELNLSDWRDRLRIVVSGTPHLIYTREWAGEVKGCGCPVGGR
ncbi:hypothetical protein [Methanopyrus sp.]